MHCPGTHQARHTAEEHFNYDQAADGMIDIFERVLAKRKITIPAKPKHVAHVVNTYVQKYKYKTYLEIGIYKKKVFDYVGCKYKSGVDPVMESEYKMMSDEFFKVINDDLRYDLIFIDGNHVEDFAERDIKNSLDHLAEGGTILVHDCNPTSKFLQREYVEGMDPPWSGQVWRAFLDIKLRRNDLEMYVIDFDTGIGVIRRGQSDPIEDMIVFSDVSYEFYDENREKLMDLHTVDQWLEKMRAE